MNNVHVAICVLSWNGYEDTVECLRSLQRLTYPSFTVYVLDNHSTVPENDRLASQFGSFIKTFRVEKNLGYSGGNNFLIERAMADGAAYVLLLNNDTTVNPDLLDQLVSVAQPDPQIGAVGAKIFYDQSTLVYAVGGGWTRFLRDDFRMLGNGQLDRPSWDTGALGYISGCCLLLSAAAIRTVGGLDDRFFLYNEETDLCIRLRTSGFRLGVAERAIVRHKVARSSKYLSPGYVYYIVRNKLLLGAKHLGRLRFALFVGVIVLREGAGYSWLSIRRGQYRSFWSSWTGIFDFFRGRFGARI